MINSGADASSLPKYKYFDEMTFLHEKSCNRPSKSNLQLQSTFILPPLSPVHWFTLQKTEIDEIEVQLTKQLSDADNDIKKLPTES